MKNKAQSENVKFYAEKKLDDGRVIATEDDEMKIGSVVFAIGDDGEATPLAQGTYTLDSGDKLVIDDNSAISELGETEVVEDEEVEAKKDNAEELAEHDAEETDWAKTFEEMKDRLAELEKAVFGEEAEEETEELSKEKVEETVNEKTEMSEENIDNTEEVISELMTQVEDLKTQIVELSKEPAEGGITYNPEGKNVTSTINLSKLSVKDRVAYYINKN